MDTRAPSPFAPQPARSNAPAGYSQAAAAAAYGQGYGTPGYDPAYPATPAFAGGTSDAEIVEAKKTHSRGTWIYLVGWIAIAVSLPLMFASIGLAISNGSLGSTAQALLLTGLGMLAAGMAVRGAGFSLMMKADFTVRAHAWLGQR